MGWFNHQPVIPRRQNSSKLLAADQRVVLENILRCLRWKHFFLRRGGTLKFAGSFQLSWRVTGREVVEGVHIGKDMNKSGSSLLYFSNPTLYFCPARFYSTWISRHLPTWRPWRRDGTLLIILLVQKPSKFACCSEISEKNQQTTKPKSGLCSF